MTSKVVRHPDALAKHVIRRRYWIALASAVFVGSATVPVVGYAQDEPMFEKLRSTFQQEYLSIGILVQTVADFQIERSFPGANGFSVANARINLFGNLDGGFSYLFTTNFVSSPAILDARASYIVMPEIVISFGQFKAPFSAEFLIYAGSIDFVNRSQVVTALAPGRQVGFQLGGELVRDKLSYYAGVFNGNGIAPNANDANDFLYVGRVMVSPIGTPAEPHSGYLGVGLNVSYSVDSDATFVGGLLPHFSGTRVLLGGDFLLVSGPLQFSGEVIASRFRSTSASPHEPYGFHATVAHRVGDRAQVLLRFDGFFADGLQDDSRLVVLGANYWPSQSTELQVNYIVPPAGAGFKNHQLLVNAQLGF